MTARTSSLLLVLSAPSGAGKTTLARRLLDEMPDAVLSVSATTRRPRGTEKDGVDYSFVDTRTFQEMIERGVFDIEAVKKANQEVIATIEDSLRIADEGKARRAAAEKELMHMEEELKRTLAAASARTQPGSDTAPAG